MSGEALHSDPATRYGSRKAPGVLHLFAATLLCRPLESLDADVDAVVRSADLEASRMTEGGRVELALRDRAAFRLVYRALRDRAARVRPGEIVAEPPWMRAISALSWLRHRQRAALILDAMTPLGVADIADVTNVSEHEAERIIATAVSSVARALGRPTDVRGDLAQAARHLHSADVVVPAQPADPGLPRSVVRLLLDAPPARAPEPPTFDPDAPAFAPDMSPVDSLLARAETEPADITFAAPTPPKPPVPIPLGVPRHGRTVARDGVIALAALVAVILALLPTSGAVRHPVHPTSPVVRAVTKVTPPGGHATNVASPSVRVHRGDSLWGIAARELRDPMRWREIWRLNRGKLMRTGQRFNDPNLIRTGWVLKIPR